LLRVRAEVPAAVPSRWIVRRIRMPSPLAKSSSFPGFPSGPSGARIPTEKLNCPSLSGRASVPVVKAAPPPWFHMATVVLNGLTTLTSVLS